MFNIAQDRRFTETITTVDGQSFTATYLILPDEDIEAFFEDGPAETGIKELLRRVVVDLGDVVGPDKTPLAFSTELLEQFLGRADLRHGLLTTYRTGRIGAQLGN